MNFKIIENELKSLNNEENKMHEQKIYSRKNIYILLTLSIILLISYRGLLSFYQDSRSFGVLAISGIFLFLYIILKIGSIVVKFSASYILYLILVCFSLWFISFLSFESTKVIAKMTGCYYGEQLDTNRSYDESCTFLFYNSYRRFPYYLRSYRYRRMKIRYINPGGLAGPLGGIMLVLWFNLTYLGYKLYRNTADNLTKISTTENNLSQ